GPGRWRRVFPKAKVAAVAWLAAFSLATWLIGNRQPASDLLDDVAYLVPIALAAGLSIHAARRGPAGERRFWRILALSNILWLLGELAWGFYELVLNRPTPFPSVADVFYIASYVLVIPAIIVGFQGAIRRSAWRALLDASVMVVAIGYTGYSLLIRPQLDYGASLATAT